jgi:hypothetical protein
MKLDRKRDADRFFWIVLIAFLFSASIGEALSREEPGSFPGPPPGQTPGGRIAFWAERFIGTPYDEDPQGAYVTRGVIVADDRMDCMYLVFRSVELALSRSPDGAVQVALEKRFHHRGSLRGNKVINYEDRFQYGEDMIRSGKWGREVTATVGRVVRLPGARDILFVEALPPAELSKKLGQLQNGDLLFFIKNPKQRTVGEIVGHMGIAKVESQGNPEVYLIHASGAKTRGGVVKKVPLQEYLSRMPFVGVQITRFD